MDKEQIKKALDHFENDEYTDAKEIIQKEVEVKRDTFIKDKLGLANDINPVAEPEANADDNKGDEEGEE